MDYVTMSQRKKFEWFIILCLTVHAVCGGLFTTVDAFLPTSQTKLSFCNHIQSSSLNAQQLGTFEVLDQIEDIRKRDVLLYNFTTTTTPYHTAWEFQKYLMGPMMEENLLAMTKKITDDNNSARNEVPGALIFLQHSPVYTLGTASDTKYIKVDIDEIENRGIDLVRIERGGEVTYHGPGQLVAYPIVNLRRAYKSDIHWYMRALEEVVILALSKAGISNAYREDGLTGVFVKNKKVAAFGVKVKRWITMHGLAVNVESESIGLDTFENIVPCGIEDKGVGFLNEFLPPEKQISLCQFSSLLLEAFEEIFCSKVRKSDSTCVFDILPSLK